MKVSNLTLIRLFLAACLLFLSACNDLVPNKAAIAPLSRLHAAATRIVDAEDQEVRLRGVNLGGWLYAETWISTIDYPDYGRLRLHAQEQGYGPELDALLREIGAPEGDDWMLRLHTALAERIGTEASTAITLAAATEPSIYDDSDLPMQQLLEKRFGTEDRDVLLDAFQAAWIGESDIEWLAKQGFNLVRVPIGYRSLITGSFLTAPTEMVWNEATFARIEQLLDWCAKYRVYAVLDLQESPGGHNTYSGPARLYEDVTSVTQTTQLWLEMARRFGSRDEVAAYSLLAEPFGAPSVAERDRVYGLLHDAIRAHGDTHLLVIHDGFFGMESLPNAASMGWTNVIYSTHLFEWGAKSKAAYEIFLKIAGDQYDSAQPTQDVPYFIGSFSTFVDADWAYASTALMLDWFEARGYSWSLWTYKRIDDPIDTELWGSSTSWGLRGRLEGQTFDRPDLYRDSFDVLTQKANQYRAFDIKPNPKLLEVLTAAARADRTKLQTLSEAD